ncbi:MAG TPA: S8 family serine peptidase [Tepidiformaceae bacterium]
MKVFAIAAALALLSALTAFGTGDVRAGASPAASRYIVVLQDGASPADIAARYGAVPEVAYQHALKGFSAQLTAAQATALRADARVALVEEDQVVTIAGGHEVPTGIQRIFADDNPNIGIDGVDDVRIDVDVAVIDTGISLSHPDLNVFRSTNCSGGAFFKQSCGSGGDDDNGHGSHVGGTIGALDNDFGVVGVAPGARLWAVKVLDKNGSGYMSWIVAGIDYVTANASEIEVANMSLGCECTSAAMDTAISNSVSAGVVYVVAAGNSTKDASTFSPANHPDVIAVSALADFNGQPGGGAASTCRSDVDDTLANFSNYGSTVDIIAPGVCITSTVPGGYATYSGTSMASPHVAGAAALLTSASKPQNKTEAVNVASTLKSSGNYNWTEDRPSDPKEPLLDVGNTAIFNPKTTAGGTVPPEDPGDPGDPGSPVMGAELEGSSALSSGRNWAGTVTATVTSGGAPLAGAVVTGTWEWNGGSTATSSCTTGSDGVCSVSRKFNGNVSSATFTVTGVVLSGYQYDGGPDSAVVSKP